MTEFTSRGTKEQVIFDTEAEERLGRGSVDKGMTQEKMDRLGS